MSDPDAGIVFAPRAESAGSLSFLRYFETLFLIDDSEHMKRQWSDVSALMQAVAPVCLKHDDNGIDMYFVNHRPLLYIPAISSVRKSGYNHIGKVHSGEDGDSHSVQSIFNKVKPNGGCKLGYRLGKILTWYLDKLKADPQYPAMNVMVITAGVSSDDYAKVLIDAAKQLDTLGAPEHQLGVMLFQLGDDDDVHRAFENIDDHLWRQAGTRDIVDTVAWKGWPASFAADDMVKAVLGAVSKKMDGAKGALAGKAPPTRRETDM